MYDFALEDKDVFNLLGKMRCPTGNTTTIEIDAFKFENANFKRSIKEEDFNFFKIENKNKNKEQHQSKINTKQKHGNVETIEVKSKLARNRTVKVMTSQKPVVNNITSFPGIKEKLNKKKTKKQVSNKKETHR